MNGAFAFEGVTKRYGAETALAGLDLDGRPGECLALIGHNGAGKTTLMKLALGLLRPSEGAVRLLGVEPAGRDGATVRRAVGFLPENVAFHDSMTGRESIAFYARLKRVPGIAGVSSRAVPWNRSGRGLLAEAVVTAKGCDYATRALGCPQRRWASPRSRARCLRSSARSSGSRVCAFRHWRYERIARANAGWSG